VALILSLRFGDDFYVGTKRFCVVKMQGTNAFTLQDEKRAQFPIDKAFSDLLPKVRCAAGDSARPGEVRAVLDAPREIVILRGKKWREAMRGPDAE
jgi:hypothetical protein